MTEYQRENIEKIRTQRDLYKKNGKVFALASAVTLAVGITGAILINKGLLGEALPYTLTCMGFSGTFIYGIISAIAFRDYRDKKNIVEEYEKEKYDEYTRILGYKDSEL